jgi:predicted Rossmann fold nucleotide-binding protein DprA/Smf involved in DNA uptake
MFVLPKSHNRYPATVVDRLAGETPQEIASEGNLDLLKAEKLAFLASAKAPGSVILSAHDLAARWRDEGRCVISGFHSPLEQECFQILLRGRQPIVAVLARGLTGMRLHAAWKRPLADGRLLLLSGFPASVKRPVKANAVERNKLVAALANEIVFAHISEGSHLTNLLEAAHKWRIPARVLSEEAC